MSQDTSQHPKPWATIGLKDLGTVHRPAFGVMRIIGADRSSEDVLDYAEENGIGFIPWGPDLGRRTRPARRTRGQGRRRRRPR